jgi:ribosome-associated protein
VLVLAAHRHRTQERNREDARARLLELVRSALHAPKPRVATKPTRASKERRLAGKQHRAKVKRARKGSWDRE